MLRRYLAAAEGATLTVMAATVDERLAQTFVELADTLVAGYDLMEFLQTLTDRCVELLEVDAAGLLLADGRGALRLVAASTEQARVVELFQIQNDEGPCLDCYRTGQAVIVSDIRADRAAARWPRFAAAAREMGYRRGARHPDAAAQPGHRHAEPVQDRAGRTGPGGSGGGHGAGGRGHHRHPAGTRRAPARKSWPGSCKWR